MAFKAPTFRLLAILAFGLVVATASARTSLAQSEAKTNKAPDKSLAERVDEAAGEINGLLGKVFFLNLNFWTHEDDPEAARKQLPLVVCCLIAAAAYFTLRMGFINIRGFWHAVRVTMGRYDDPAHHGEVSHFQALSAALSGTVGLGNIAGVAIAISVGGPGATFWMIVAGVMGMASKFTECTLGQKYREFRPDGQVMGGAMHYLSKGLRELGLAPLGAWLAVIFSVMCVGGSLGGGNMFQVSQSLNGVREILPLLNDAPWVYGLLMVVMVGLVILGGIRRIGATAEKIVPLMCGFYVLACLGVLLTHFDQIPAALGRIVREAFQPMAGFGGLVGVLVTGFKRAAFSNEAGTGSAAIAHSAARTPYPVREGIVALLEPFIDTVVVCTMTALVIVITGAFENPAYADLRKATNGAALTARAIGETMAWFTHTGGFALCVFLFAYSTLLSWYYYGERCWCYLLGDRASLAFKFLFLAFTFLGSIISASNVLEFGDMMILGMAFPNLLGVVLLSGVVRRDLAEYWRRYKAGDFERERAGGSATRPG
jgi:AGCS family alanine or glycine:cation symporter